MTYIIAKECNLEPDKIIITIGDAHIYESHIKQVIIQMNNQPFKFPILRFDKKNIHEYQFEDFKLCDYKSHNRIKAEMIP